jgi:hypothetical protein
MARLTLKQVEEIATNRGVMIYRWGKKYRVTTMEGGHSVECDTLNEAHQFVQNWWDSNDTVMVSLKLNFELLRVQKAELIQIAAKERRRRFSATAYLLDGLIEMLDEIQDTAAKQHSEFEVFGAAYVAAKESEE